MKNKRTITKILLTTQLIGLSAPLILPNPISVHAEEATYSSGNIIDIVIESEEQIKAARKKIAKVEKVVNAIDDYDSLIEAIEVFGELEINNNYVEDVKDIHDTIVQKNNDVGDGNSTIFYLNTLIIALNERDLYDYDELVYDLIEENEHDEANKEIKRVEDIFDLFIIRKTQGSGEVLEAFIGKNNQLRIPVIEEALKYWEEGEKNNPSNDNRPPQYESKDEIVEEVEHVDDDSFEYGGTTSEYDDEKDKFEPDDITGSYYEFDQEKGQRILVEYTITYKNGEAVRSEKKTVEASGLTAMWSDQLDDIFGGDIVSPAYGSNELAEPEKEPGKTHTLQYTVNKKDKFPLYVDTGIFVDEEYNASYEDLYDVLLQIAINAKDGYLTEDSDKLLIIVEGEPIYITEIQETYSIDEVEAIFDGFEEVGLYVKETRIGTTESLEWQLKTGQEQMVAIGNEVLKLKTQPDIRENTVVLPIAEMFTNVGGQVEEEDGIITVQYGSDTITFEVGVKEAKLNDTHIKLIVPVDRNEKGMLTTNLTTVFDALGIKVTWDEQESTLRLTNTIRREDKGKQEELPKEEAPVEEEEVEEEKSATYTVVRGDTLSAIARDNDLTVNELMKINNLTGDLILVGQVLLLK